MCVFVYICVCICVVKGNQKQTEVKAVKGVFNSCDSCDEKRETTASVLIIQPEGEGIYSQGASCGDADMDGGKND